MCGAEGEISKDERGDGASARDAASDARALAEALAPCFASLADACLRAHEAVCAIADVAPTTTLTTTAHLFSTFALCTEEIFEKK